MQWWRDSGGRCERLQLEHQTLMQPADNGVRWVGGEGPGQATPPVPLAQNGRTVCRGSSWIREMIRAELLFMPLVPPNRRHGNSGMKVCAVGKSAKGSTDHSGED